MVATTGLMSPEQSDVTEESENTNDILQTTSALSEVYEWPMFILPCGLWVLDNGTAEVN